MRLYLNNNLPTILKVKSFRFFFYSDEGNEPPHVHIENADGECKFWLNPVKLASSRNLSGVIIREIERIIVENKPLLIEKYASFHSK